MEDHIVPECYFDTVLVKTILKRKKVNHQKSCFKVESTVRQIDDFALGIIDKDKRGIQYLEECAVEIETDNLILWKHREKHHYFIQLIPGIETWILNAAKESNLNVEEIGIPNDLERLKKLTKHEVSSESEVLRNLCTRLVADNGNTIVMLSSWLNYLFEHNRDADIKVLKNV